MRYILRSLIFLHRWVGVVLCPVFLLWFPSGIGMMYWTFPGVSAEDRLNHSPKLDPAKITLSPAEAAEKAGVQPNPAQIRLNSFDGRPVYRVGGGGGRGGGRGGGGARIIYADTGEQHTEVSAEMLDRIASAWAGQPFAAAKKESVDQVDQWTVAGQLANLRPTYKYSWPDGQQVYMNGVSGEVVQYTTSFSRFAAHISAIPHWVYYTPLRKHQPQWLSFMIYSSLIGTGGAIVGMIIAVWMYSPKQRYRLAGKPTGIPYRGQKRWHWILGIVFGVATVTWTFSGLLSLGPFPLVQRLTQTASQRAQQQAQQQQVQQQQAQQADQSNTEEPQQQAAVQAPRGGNDGGAPEAVQSGGQRTGEGAQTQSDQQPQAGQRRGGRGRGGFGRGGRRGGNEAENRRDAETPAAAADSPPPRGNTPGAQPPNQGRGTGGNRGQVASNQGSQNANAGNANTRGGGGPQGPAGALRGRVRWADFAAVHPRDVLAKNPQLDVRELAFTSFDSTPLLNVNLSEGKSQLLSLDGTVVDGFDQQKVIDIVKNALPDPKIAEVKMIDQYDLYYFDRLRQRPLPVILVLTNDADRTRYYVDPKTAQVLTTYSDRSWVNRWLYTGLHSLNFPFLYNHRPLWDIVVITFMLGGTALCVTSLVLAWRTLGRKLRRAAVNDVLPRET